VEKKPNRFGQDELDDAVIAADDTGLIQSQHEIAEEEILEDIQPDENAPEER
jgi:hypothetical protein